VTQGVVPEFKPQYYKKKKKKNSTKIDVDSQWCVVTKVKFIDTDIVFRNGSKLQKNSGAM
jgi:hypothetical protein